MYFYKGLNMQHDNAGFALYFVASLKEMLWV